MDRPTAHAASDELCSHGSVESSRQQSTAPCSWEPGPERPLLAVGAVHVWRADLSAAADGLCRLLCPEERARGERIVNEHKRTLWMRSRGVLRELLGRYLDEDPRTLRLAIGAHGKPALRKDGAVGAGARARSLTNESPRLAFNLSHSRGLALYAFAHCAVGVDIELLTGSRNVVGIAAQSLGEAEAARLRLLDSRSREREFLRAWVRHEAELKCLGVGLGRKADAERTDRPWTSQPDVGPLAAAAVAVTVAPHELHCWER